MSLIPYPSPTLTPLSIIPNLNGDIYHVIKSSSPSFKGFGEAYFSFVHSNSIKGWKLHTQMTLNLVVPVGSVKFVIYDSRDYDNPSFYEYLLSPNSYSLLTIPPNLWVGFKGMSSNSSLVLNIANIHHQEDELIRSELSSIAYDW